MRLSIRARTWTALAIPPVAWFAFQQGLSALLHADCRLAIWGIAWGGASLLACLAAVVLALPLARHRGPLANPWLARMALGLSGLFALAIVFQMLAVAMVPPCVG